MSPSLGRLAPIPPSGRFSDLALWASGATEPL